VVSELSGQSGPTRALSPADTCVSFLINGGAFRGRLVRLSESADTILARHRNPEPVAALLAEAMVAGVALAGGLKFKGVFTLQIQGDGPVHMLVTDVTSEGQLRACAKFDADKLGAVTGARRGDGSRLRLLGNGHLAFTVDQGPDTERFQGIIELSSGKLADSIHQYFRQSEQIESAIKIAVAPPEPATGGKWTAAALVIQRMPEDGGVRGMAGEDMDDAWRAAVIMLGSLKDAELLDLNIAPEMLLYRLYGTMDVRAAAPRPIVDQCRCSKARTMRILASFPADEVKSFAADGKLSMTCEFCQASYEFSVAEVDALAEKNRSQQEKAQTP
jgi:molecular chaperone Hsp33